jgi:hypothetical protein
MAAPHKPQLDYAPHYTNIHSQKPIRKLRASHGPVGYLILDYIKCLCYGTNGYWVAYDDDLCFDVSDFLQCNITPQMVTDVVIRCIELGIFDQDVFAQHSVITSLEIQLMYAHSKRTPVFAQHLYINPPFEHVILSKRVVITDTTTVNAAITTQSKVKESKEKKINSELLQQQLSDDTQPDNHTHDTTTYNHQAFIPDSALLPIEEVAALYRQRYSSIYEQVLIGITPQQGELKFAEFVKEQKTKHTHRSLFEFTQHFSNWMKLNKYKPPPANGNAGSGIAAPGNGKSFQQLKDHAAAQLNGS